MERTNNLFCDVDSGEKLRPEGQRTIGVRCFAQWRFGPAEVLKRPHMGVRCISRFGDGLRERIEAQVGGDPAVMGWSWSPLVTLPAAQGHRANLQ